MNINDDTKHKYILQRVNTNKRASFRCWVRKYSSKFRQIDLKKKCHLIASMCKILSKACIEKIY
jgi:hypothetical protein